MSETATDRKGMTDQGIRIAIAEVCGYERLKLGYESLTAKPGLIKGPEDIWRTPGANKWYEEIKKQGIQCVGNYFVRLSDGQIFADFNGPDTGANGMGNFDYTTDLNAMHEAEKTLDLIPDYGSKKSQYFAWLLVVIGLVDTYESAIYINVSWVHGERVVSATAKQRAEALLRTLDRWKETP